MTAPTTVDLADLLARVPDGVGIDMPGPEGGWAVAVIGGREYRARVGAVCPGCGGPAIEGPTDSDGREWCGECAREGVPS